MKTVLFHMNFELERNVPLGPTAEIFCDTRLVNVVLGANHDLPLFIAMIEHECVHQILYDLFGEDAFYAYDNIAGLISWDWMGKVPTFAEW